MRPFISTQAPPGLRLEDSLHRLQLLRKRLSAELHIPKLIRQRRAELLVVCLKVIGRATLSACFCKEEIFVRRRSVHDVRGTEIG